MVCEMEPGMSLGVHATTESCQVRRGDDRVVCAQVWSQRAGPPHRLCSLLAIQPCVNCLAPLNHLSLYSKIYPVRVHMFMVVIIKTVITGNLLNPWLRATEMLGGEMV